ncbi:MAG: type II toxin-antitoxin system HicA family toxin [Bauldia sp.]|nr:type II toxin-antitoxin system HicA family toxin [Bauldia sp.]
MSSSRDIRKRLEREGWSLERIRGSHHVFRNPKTGAVIVLPHPKKDLGMGDQSAVIRISQYAYNSALRSRLECIIRTLHNAYKTKDVRRWPPRR